MSRVYGDPFKIDWTNLEEVVTYAKKLGPGNVVIKYSDRSNYNITHAGRWGEFRIVWSGPYETT